MEKYRRLPGNAWTRSRKFFDYGRSTLWFSDDHVLHVRSTAFSETYRRLYFKDIQAIVLSRNAARRNINLAFGAGVLIFAAIILSVYIYAPRSADIAGVAFGIQAGVFLVYILINTLLGPTCYCRIHTAVQAEEIKSLGRMRTAKKAIGILKPLIEEAQKGLVPEVSVEAAEEQQSILRASAHELAEAKPEAKARETRHVDAKAHGALFGFMFAGAISSLVELVYQGRIKNLVDMLLFLGIILLLIVSLRRQSNSDLPGSVKAMTWVALGAMITNFLFGFCFGVYYVFAHMSEMSEITPAADFHFKGPVFQGYCITVAIIEGAVAIAGLALLGSHRLRIFSPTMPSDAAAQKES